MVDVLGLMVDRCFYIAVELKVYTDMVAFPDWCFELDFFYHALLVCDDQVQCVWLLTTSVFGLGPLHAGTKSSLSDTP